MVSLGCAANDDSTGGDDDVRTTSGATESHTADEGASGESIDKALRKNWCCAVQDGDKTKYCIGYKAVKAWATTKCNLGNGFESTLRDGKCSQYKSCQGKEGPCVWDTPDGPKERPCDARAPEPDPWDNLPPPSDPW